VPGGSRRYVQRVIERLDDARLNTPVRRVIRRSGMGIRVDTDEGHEWFDEVVFACHADQALAVLGDATPMEQALLECIRYRENLALLHTDTRLLPRRRKAWAAWNHEYAPSRPNEAAGACVHYWLNRLQALPFEQPLVLTLNPRRQPDSDSVIGEFRFSHPVFDGKAIEAQGQLRRLQGHQHSWFCGAWTKYGFHEDGLRSGLEVADSLIECMRERACAVA
jgi:predicted NAD/FAD-binding protein